jgi:hypothetical protein
LKTKIKRLSLLTLAAGLSIAVLFLSYPRLASSLSYLPVEAALKRHWEDYPITERQFPALINFAQKSIQKLDHARYWQGLGWLYFLQAYTLQVNTSAGQKSLDQSQSAFESTLKKSPADPASWLRLAWIHYYLRHDRDLVVKTLKMSIYTGRAEHYLILDRLALSLRYADSFEAQDLPLIRDQIQLAWRFYPKELLAFMESGEIDRIALLGLIAASNPELAIEIEGDLIDNEKLIQQSL